MLGPLMFVGAMVALFGLALFNKRRYPFLFFDLAKTLEEITEWMNLSMSAVLEVIKNVSDFAAKAFAEFGEGLLAPNRTVKQDRSHLPHYTIPSKDN